MAQSILQKSRMCFICGSVVGVEEHHIFAGTANKKISEKYGLKVYLCREHHTGKNGAQYNPKLNRALKRLAQIAFEGKHSREEWMAIIGENYLDKELFKEG